MRWHGAGGFGHVGDAVADVLCCLAQVDFGHASGGESNFARASVSAAWVAGGSVILCAVASGSADHDPEDGALEGITATACNLVEGSGFDVIAHAPGGSWGRYNINIMGL